MRGPICDPLHWEVVDETKRLLAVPSIGSLLPGWLLVVPKRHALSFGALPDGAASQGELTALAERWAATFGPLTWFEHGPAQRASPVGCSIDHAHMHLVPAGGLDLLAGARALFPAIDFAEVPGVEAVTAPVRSERPYLFLRTPDGRCWLASHTDLPSQAFRRVIAHLQGRPEVWDWRRFPHSSALSRTVKLARRDYVAA